MAGVIAPAAWLLTGCASGGGDVFRSVALPSEQSADAAADSLELATPPDRLAGKPTVTPAQRDYLDDLASAGVHPATDLRALSIGAYVCQARAAGQSPQAVWEAVAPMVRGDIADASAATPAVSHPPVDAAVDHYIGIAQQRLC